ncbi:hypothetical protein B0H17DRAFT_111323 [Mycena rosella]|uniref:Zn(2)-C6 fungal-type domain-containing protein n=1 Tax=Mycena rosella TaxID=1033263 RepID=A0AAD7D419_MYCRO|nr:hypothetical protein B0H17DRAFT_111323 [Mycena rosella]
MCAVMMALSAGKSPSFSILSPMPRASQNPFKMSETPAQSALLAVSNIRRRRALIACTNCRKRKIKCVNLHKDPQGPCARCQKRGLVCEYVQEPELTAGSSNSIDGRSSPVKEDSWFAPAYAGYYDRAIVEEDSSPNRVYAGYSNPAYYSHSSSTAPSILDIHLLKRLRNPGSRILKLLKMASLRAELMIRDHLLSHWIRPFGLRISRALICQTRNFG